MIAGLLIVGMLLISSALKGTEHELGAQLQFDLLGKNGFIVWLMACLGLGVLGYIPALQRASRYLLALLCVVLLLRNGGVFANMQAALQSASAYGPAPSVSIPSSGAGATSSSSGSGTSALSTVAALAPIALALL